MSKVQLNVKFYDKNEKKLFKDNYPQKVYDKLEKLTGESAKVSYEDFRTYGLLQHLNPSLGNLGSLQYLVSRKEQLLGIFDFYTLFNSNTERITSRTGSANEQTTVSETLGVAGALSVADAAFGTTPADWSKIMMSNHKDFDFNSSISPRNKRQIVVEAKGSVLKDNAKKESTISKHKKSIKDKKADQGFKDKYSHGTDVLLGIITVADTEHDLVTYLVDPPAESELNDEIRSRIKLFKRLQFYTYWVNAMGAKSDLSKALINRISALEGLSDPFELQNSALKKGNSEEMFWDDSILSRYSHISDEIIGKVLLIDKSSAFFFGLKTDLIGT